MNQASEHLKREREREREFSSTRLWLEPLFTLSKGILCAAYGVFFLPFVAIFFFPYIGLEPILRGYVSPVDGDQATRSSHYKVVLIQIYIESI